MILSDEGIARALKNGEIEVEPPPEQDQYTTSAVDLTIGDQFQVWNEKICRQIGAKIELDLDSYTFLGIAGAYLAKVEREKDGSFIFPPFSVSSSHVLGKTHERVHLRADSQLAARVEGRSSLARLGLIVHLTAPTIHAGFNGTITLEMINHGPFYLKMRPGKTRICQLILERLETPPKGGIATQFQGQSTPSGSASKS